MVVVPYKVCVVVDREFGEQLAGLPPGEPVWIVDTPLNESVTQRLWKERLAENHLTGITTFKDSPSMSSEDLLISELGTIDLHHGPHSAEPPYTVLEVFGALLSDRAKDELCQLGFRDFHAGSAGFRAVRPATST